MNKRETYSGGSIVSFIVVGVVLAAVLAGGIYFLTQRSEQARRDTAIAQVEENQEDENANGEVTMPGGSSEDEGEEEPSPYPASDKGEATTDDEAATTEAESGEATTESDETAENTESDDSGVAATTSGDDDTTLPETGPGETVATMVVVMAVTFAGVAFVRSQRQRSLDFDL